MEKLYMNIPTGTVQTMEEWEDDQVTLGFDPHDLDELVEVIKDSEGVPKQFVVHRYTTKEKQTDRTSQINKERAKEADDKFRRALPQLGFLRQVMSMKLAPRVVRPSNYTFTKKGTFKIQYITSEGLIRQYTPRQIKHFLEMKGRPRGKKRGK